MNQILITGAEKVKKPKKVLEIKTIVLFYAISIIILGICMISGTVYANVKINETVKANAKPSVQIDRNDEDNKVEINVKHIRGIKTISYRWNEEEETVINANNQKEVTETVNLLGGVNTLTVSVTEENGQTVSYNKTYTVGNIPEIELEAVSNGIKIIATSEHGIKNIKYSWDSGEEKEITVEEKEYEGIINAPKGKHTLKIDVFDKNGNKGTKTQVVVGDTAPTVEVKADIKDGKVIFVIDAKDDENLTNIEITLNGAEKEVIEVNSTTYHKELEMIEGENRIIVTAYNNNGLSTTVRRKFTN